MNRRQFLKTSLAAFAAFLLARTFFKPDDNSQPQTGIKEALFYRAADDLAG